LRDTARAGAADLGEGFATPESEDRVQRLERALARLVRTTGDPEAAGREIFAASGSALEPAQAWVLAQVHWRTRYVGEVTLRDIARAHWVPRAILEPAITEVARAGLVDFDGNALALTGAGRAEVDRLREGWHRWLGTHLDDWSPDDPEDRSLLQHAIDNTATRLLVDEQSRLARAAA
jgi:hypothetical protein